jgi:hypothetical protein
MTMPMLLLTLQVEIGEETLEEIRAAQEYGGFGADEALVLLRDCVPATSLVRVEDENR